jgi:hypothetical protein
MTEGSSSNPGRINHLVFSKSSRPDVGPHSLQASVYSGVKRPGREGDHSLATSVEFKKSRICTSASHTPSWRRIWLVKHTDSFPLLSHSYCYWRLSILADESLSLGIRLATCCSWLHLFQVLQLGEKLQEALSVRSSQAQDVQWGCR